jgi:predicted metal-dependent hydrolase
VSLQAALDRADELGAKGLFFEAHEELEAFWMKAAGAEKILLQGLIQIAAGLHRVRHKPEQIAGAFYLLDRGVEKLSAHAALLEPETLSALLAAVARIRDSGKAPASMIFGLRAAHKS